jgi:hypothetical protein
MVGQKQEDHVMFIDESKAIHNDKKKKRCAQWNEIVFFAVVFVGMCRQTSQLNVGDLSSHANNGIYFCVIIALALLYYFLNNLSVMPKVV